MTLDEKVDALGAAVAKVGHVLGNMANVVNLYVEQERRLTTDPVWVARSMVMIMEDDADRKFTADQLRRALVHLDEARAVVLTRLGL